MKEHPRFLVLHLRHVIIAAVIFLLLILLSIVLIVNTSDKNTDETPSGFDKATTPTANETTPEVSSYIPGVYTSAVTLDNSVLELKLYLDSNHINAVTINNSDASISCLYPLMSSSLDDIAAQVCSTQSLNEITVNEASPYTYSTIMDAARQAANKAK